MNIYNDDIKYKDMLHKSNIDANIYNLYNSINHKMWIVSPNI